MMYYFHDKTKLWRYLRTKRPLSFLVGSKAVAGTMDIPDVKGGAFGFRINDQGYPAGRLDDVDCVKVVGTLFEVPDLADAILANYDIKAAKHACLTYDKVAPVYKTDRHLTTVVTWPADYYTYVMLSDCAEAANHVDYTYRPSAESKRYWQHQMRVRVTLPKARELFGVGVDFVYADVSTAARTDWYGNTTRGTISDLVTHLRRQERIARSGAESPTGLTVETLQELRTRLVNDYFKPITYPSYKGAIGSWSLPPIASMSNTFDTLMDLPPNMTVSRTFADMSAPERVDSYDPITKKHIAS